MADQKISELTALTDGVAADYLPIVDQSAGQTKKITLDNLAANIYPMYSSMQINPLARAQGVNMTAAASGSTGITVADSVHLDQGTRAFILSCKRNLASYVVAAILMEKHDDTTGYRLSTVVTTGYLKLEINDTVYTSSAAPVITGGTEHEFTVTVSPGATDTTVTFYCDGIIVGTAQTATNETTTDNAVSFYAMGTDAIRTAGIDKGNLIYNRALTAAQVLDLYRNGVDFADKWGSQTERISNGTFDSDLTGWSTSAGWAWQTDGGGGGWLRHTAGNTVAETYSDGNLFTIGKRYRLSLEIGGRTAGYCSIHMGSGNSQGALSSNGSYVFENINIGTNGFLYLYPSTDFDGYIDNVFVKEIGATLALEGEGIQIGKWYDSSSNNLDASYPAAGSSLIRKPFRGVTQPTPSAKTTAVTLTIAELLTRIITGTHTVGATQAYTLPTGTLCEAGGFFNINDSIDWVLINLSAAAADTITVTAGATHTIVGNPIVQAAHASTGGIYGNSATFRTRKTALNTFVTYRVA